METKLQHKRLEKGYTQKEIAEWTKIPLQTIQKLEIGHNKIDSIRIKQMLALCRELECFPEDILEDEENCYRFLTMRIMQ